MERILVIQTAFIGDAVLTLPMLQKLGELYPDSEIDVLSTPVSSGLFSSSPSVSDVISYNKRGSEGSLFRLPVLAGKLKKRGYTRIYSPHRSARTSLIVMLTGVKETYGFSNASLKYLYNHLIEYRSDYHEVRRNLELIGFRTDENSWKIPPVIKLTAQEQDEADRFICSHFHGRSIVAVAPGSVWETKKYPEEYFIRIIKYIRDDLGLGVLLTGGPADENYLTRMASECGESVVSAAGKFSVTGSIALIKKSRLMISNDSAPTHFAMCAGVPALTIFCSTIPGFGFYPYNSGSISVSYDKLDCKPCGIHGHTKCPTGTFECAHKIDITFIKNKLAELINGK